MKTLRVRVADLRLDGSERGLAYRAWILVGGKRVAVQGQVPDQDDLERELIRQVRRVYLEVVGEPYPDSPFRS